MWSTGDYTEPCGGDHVAPAGRNAAIPSPLLERAREIYAAHRRANQRVTGSVLARELDISDGYGRRLLRQLAADGVAKHDDGAETDWLGTATAN